MLFLQIALFIDLLLDITEFDIPLDNVDVGVSHESADLPHIVGLDIIIAVGTSHRLAESNQTLKLSDCNLVG